MEPAASPFSQPAPWVILAITVILVAIFALASIGSAIWAARDAGQRGKSSALIGAMVLLTWPLGLIIWLVARPQAPGQR